MTGKKLIKRVVLCLSAAVVMGVLLWLVFGGGLNIPMFSVFSAAVIFLLFAGAVRLAENKSKPRRIITYVLWAILSVFAAANAVCYALAPTFLFHPSFNVQAYNELANYERVEEIVFEGENGEISGWLMDNYGDEAPLVLYFGGNTEYSANRILYLLNNEKQMSAFDGCNFAFVDYPGYGKSEGVPSEASFKQFGVDAYDYFDGRYERIVIMGYSIGTGVANYTASQRDADGLILMSPYADGYDLYNGFVNVFYGPMRIFVDYRMEAVKFAEEIELRPLILASPADRIVRYSTSVRLSAAYPYGCRFVTVEGIAHNQFLQTDLVLEEIRAYLKKTVG